MGRKDLILNRSRSPVTTINMWGEGDRESSFLGYLYKIYHIPERRVKICNAHGGDPEAQIRQMINHYSIYSYDEKYALFDLDRGDEPVQKAKQLAESFDIICIVSDRSLEIELIKIITNDPKTLKRSKKSSKEAKKVFAELCKLKNIDDDVEWGRYFKRDILEKAKSDTNWLKRLISVIRPGEYI